MGDVLRFPNQRSCFLCEHFTPAGTCAIDGEEIDSEIFAAKSCEDYEVGDG